MLLLGQTQQAQAEQRTVLEIEGLSGLSHHVLLRQRPALGLGQRTQISDRQFQRLRFGDTLKRALTLLTKGGAQALVPRRQ
ncbi:hypothetical protein D3C81_1845020 [compost metagenome]